MGAGTGEHNWLAVLEILWARDRCSWKGTEWSAGYPHARPVPFLFAEAMSFIYKWEIRGSKTSRVDEISSCCRGARAIVQPQGELLTNKQGVLSFFLSLFPMYEILKKMEMSFWEQYLNSQELTYSIEDEFNFNQVYIQCCF